MKRAIVFFILTAAMVLAPLLVFQVGGPVHGQIAGQIELACPQGMFPISSFQTYNPTTQKFRQYGCEDASGNVYLVVDRLGFGTGTQTLPVGYTAPSAGLPSVIYSTPSASSAASIPATTMTTAPVGGAKYLLSGTLVLTAVGTGCTGATTISLLFSYTDAVTGVLAGTRVMVGAATVAPTALSGAPGIATLNGVVGDMSEFFPVVINASGGTAVTYTTTYTAGGACAPGPSYYAMPVLVRVQ